MEVLHMLDIYNPPAPPVNPHPGQPFHPCAICTTAHCEWTYCPYDRCNHCTATEEECRLSIGNRPCAIPNDEYTVDD